MICVIDDCERTDHTAHGLCRQHYDRQRRSGSTRPAVRWVNPLVCVCPEPDADPRRDAGMCHRCYRKPLALMAVAS